MREIAISKFKATCLAELERVNRTKVPLRVTKRGKPIAEIGPARIEKRASRFGCMIGEGEIVGDIVSPVLGWPKWAK
jgi:prevent-host-death family protein